MAPHLVMCFTRVFDAFSPFTVKTPILDGQVSSFGGLSLSLGQAPIVWMDQSYALETKNSQLQLAP